jgi:hypothetical protein
MERLRRPKIKDGELKVYWGRLPHDNPDIIIEYRGDHTMKRDSNLLFCVLTNKSVDPFTKPLFSKMNPSLAEELEARGYDITTLKFSISKKIDVDVEANQ